MYSIPNMDYFAAKCCQHQVSKANPIIGFTSYLYEDFPACCSITSCLPNPSSQTNDRVPWFSSTLLLTQLTSCHRIINSKLFSSLLNEDYAKSYRGPTAPHPTPPMVKSLSARLLTYRGPLLSPVTNKWIGTD